MDGFKQRDPDDHSFATKARRDDGSLSREEAFNLGIETADDNHLRSEDLDDWFASLDGCEGYHCSLPTDFRTEAAVSAYNEGLSCIAEENDAEVRHR